VGEGPRVGGAEGRARLKFAALVVVGWLAVIWLWPVAPLALTADDSFYYFGIARNIAAGRGPTLGIEPTSGFHPLWCAMLVPLAGFSTSAPEAFVRVVLTLQLGIVAFAIWRLGRLAAIVFASCALVFWFTKIFVNGLESALEFALLVFALETARRADRLVLLGALCGLLTLARLSAVIGAGCLLVVALRRARSPRRASVLAISAFVAPVAAYSVWLLARFGHPFPISGAIKYAHVLHWSWVVPLVVAATATAVQRELRSPSWPIWATPLVVWVMFQLTCDATLRSMVVPEIWYLVPHATLFVLTATLTVPRFSRVTRGCAVALGLIAIPIWYSRLQPVSYSSYVEARNAGRWLADNTPHDARVGGWDSGIEAFYSNRTFFNLDGLASSWEYKTKYLEKGRIREFLDDRNIDYVAQYLPANADPLPTLRLDPSRWEVVYDRQFAFRGIHQFHLSPSGHRYVIARRL
jgi:hypothetical protein